MIQRIGTMINLLTSLNFIQLANKLLEDLRMLQNFKFSLIIVLKFHWLILWELIISCLWYLNNPLKFKKMITFSQIIH